MVGGDCVAAPSWSCVAAPSLLLLLSLSSVIASPPSILHTSIACDKSDFVLKIRFNDSFHGLIYTEKGDPNCVYADGEVQSKNNYSLKIPLTGCETRRNPHGHYENELVVQGGRTFSHREDKKFLLTCIPAQPASSQVTLSFGGVTVSSVSSTAASISAQGDPVDYSVGVLDGSSLDSPILRRPLSVGDRVSYVVKVSSPSGSRIGRCWATDSKTSLSLADEEGCSLQSEGDVWGDFEQKRGERGETLFINHIKAWAFPTSNEVNIFCNLHVCPSCAQSSCSRRSARSHHNHTQQHTVLQLETSFRLRRNSSSLPSPSPDASLPLWDDPPFPSSSLALSVPSSSPLLPILHTVLLLLLLVSLVGEYTNPLSVISP